MKNFFKGLLRAIAIVFVPALFIGALWFALSQTFAIGLVIIFALMIIQFMLSKKNSDAFKWDEYTDLTISYGNGNYRFNKKLNILFNLTKVATVLGLFRLIYMNYSDILNPFGGLGITLYIVCAIISVLAVSFNGHISSYEALRSFLGIVVALTTISFVYMSFGTQLIWIPLVALVIFGMLIKGFKEIENVMHREGLLEIFLPIIILITSLVSTIIQFWSYIANFFIAIWDFIVKVGTYELIPSIQIWVVLLSAGFIAAIIFSARYAGKKDREKRERQRLQKEKEAKAIEDKRIKDEQAAKLETEEKAYKEEASKKINALATQLKDRPAKIEEIVYLAKLRNKFNDSFLDNFSVSSLTNIVLGQFITVSDIKKQIVWEPDFEWVLAMYSALYARNYQDDNLQKIIDRFVALEDYLEDYKDFNAYKLIKEKITETKIPVTREN